MINNHCEKLFIYLNKFSLYKEKQSSVFMYFERGYFFVKSIQSTY